MNPGSRLLLRRSAKPAGPSESRGSPLRSISGKGCETVAGLRRPRHPLCSRQMAALRMLWTGLVLLGLLGLLQTSAQGHESVHPNFQQDKFLGRWYSAGLASNSSWFREKKAVISMCKTVIASSTDGGLNLTSTFLRKNQCETKIMLLQPVGLPGHYKYNSPHWGSVHTVLVMETNYNEYALLFSRGTRGPGQDFRMATLYSRSTTPKDKLKKKFINFSKSMGLTEEDIVFLPQPDKCIQE